MATTYADGQELTLPTSVLQGDKTESRVIMRRKKLSELFAEVDLNLKSSMGVPTAVSVTNG